MELATLAGDRRIGTQSFVNEMVEERQAMWVLYCKVAGLEPFNESRSIRELVEQFCQVLVDYVSSGHFGLYERIAERKERRRGVLEVAADVYERIAQSTDIALKFNDTHEPGSNFELDDEFARDLSELGEALAVRSELEDRIIEKMLVK